MTSRPLLAHTREDLQAALTRYRVKGSRVALVPTMGALHDGHAALMERARDEVGPGAAVVVSIFVNPMQFAPGEDLDRYPRTLEADLAICADRGVDVVFAPSLEEVYPGGQPQVTVDPGPLATVLEGATRPTHFHGVLTVVAKLFGLVRPDVAVFGQKDYQQLVLITRMVSDLCMGVEVVGGETFREPDGLALSSRNRYLDEEGRRQAGVLSRALCAARSRASYGVAAARRAADQVLAAEPAVSLDYLALCDSGLAELAELADSDTEPRQGRALIAARVGTTRLIDNLAVEFGREGAG